MYNNQIESNVLENFRNLAGTSQSFKLPKLNLDGANLVLAANESRPKNIPSLETPTNFWANPAQFQDRSLVLLHQNRFNHLLQSYQDLERAPLMNQTSSAVSEMTMRDPYYMNAQYIQSQEILLQKKYQYFKSLDALNHLITQLMAPKSQMN